MRYKILSTAAPMRPATKKRRTYLKRYTQTQKETSISSLYCIHLLSPRIVYTFYLHVLYTPTLTLQFTSVQRDFSTETIGLVSKDTKWVSLVRWGQQDWMEYQEDKRSAISWRSNLFWDASITPLHSAFTRTSLMIAAACPVGSSDVLRSMNICTTLGQSIKLFY